MLRRVVGLYYSPLGYSAEMTAKLASELASNITCACIEEVSCECIDLLNNPPIDDMAFDDETVVVLGMPEMTGRLPLECVKLMQKLRGDESMTVAVVAHRNSSYGEALYELYTFAEEQGFRVVGAGAFVAEEPTKRNKLTSRPDEADYGLLKEFACSTSKKLVRLAGCSVNGLKVKPAPLYIKSNRTAFTGILRPVAAIGRIVYKRRKEPEWFL